MLSSTSPAPLKLIRQLAASPLTTLLVSPGPSGPCIAFTGVACCHLAENAVGLMFGIAIASSGFMDGLRCIAALARAIAILDSGELTYLLADLRAAGGDDMGELRYAFARGEGDFDFEGGASREKGVVI